MNMWSAIVSFVLNYGPYLVKWVPYLFRFWRIGKNIIRLIKRDPDNPLATVEQIDALLEKAVKQNTEQPGLKHFTKLIDLLK